MGDSMVVVDANGQRIGFGTDSGVVFEEPGVPVFPMSVGANHLGGGAALNFESDDCSGEPYMSSSIGLVPRVYAPPPSDEVPVRVAAGSEREIERRSQLRTSGISSICQTVGAATNLVVPTVPVFVWQQQFAVPFRLTKLSRLMEGGQ